MWAAGLDGHISPFRRGPTIGVEKSFSDVSRRQMSPALGIEALRYRGV